MGFDVIFVLLIVRRQYVRKHRHDLPRKLYRDLLCLGGKFVYTPPEVKGLGLWSGTDSEPRTIRSILQLLNLNTSTPSAVRVLRMLPDILPR